MDNPFFEQAKERSRFVQVPIELLREVGERKLDAWDVVVYMLIKSKCINKSYCWHSIPTLAREIARSQSTVERAISNLTKTGHIFREQTGNSAKTHLISDVGNGGSFRRPVDALKAAAAARKHQRALEQAHRERAGMVPQSNRLATMKGEAIPFEDAPF